MSEEAGKSLTNTERMLIGKLLDWDVAFPPYTKYAVLKSLVEEGLIELRVTAQGRRALEQSVSRSYPLKTPYAAQIRAPRFHGDPSDRGWITLSKSETESVAAEALWHTLQQNGFRTGELREHCADLAKGYVLTAEDGTAFRVVRTSVFDLD